MNPISLTDQAELLELRQMEHPSMHAILCPAFWHRAVDAYVFDKDGRRWIDFTSSIAVANAGHSNPQIAQAVREALQDELFTTYTFPHRKRLALSRRLHHLLQDATNGADYRMQYMTAGTEAVEAAISVALAYHRKKRAAIISFYNAFHGNTLAADSLSGAVSYSVYKNSDGQEIHFVKLPYIHRQLTTVPSLFTELGRMLRKYDLSASDVAAVIVEPYQGKGVFVAEQQFIEDIVTFCKQENALVIFDEIQSGFYRTGTWFAFEHFKVVPDIVCFGKGLTSSLPMSGVAVKSSVLDAAEGLDMPSTHSANPIACAAALASIEVLDDDKVRAVQSQLAQMLSAGIAAMADAFGPTISYSEAFGMTASLHFTGHDQPSSEIARRVVSRCFENGLLVTGPNGPFKSYIRITPPLTIDPATLQKGLNTLNKVLKEIYSELPSATLQSSHQFEQQPRAHRRRSNLQSASA